MKKLFSLLTILVLSHSLKSQNIPNPYASIGKPAPKVATLTNGAYDEFFIKDSLVLINNDAISRKTGDIVFSKEEHPEIIAQLIKNEEDKFRFLSVDPLTKSYPELTPYQFASNTPIQASDLDGLEALYRQHNFTMNAGKTQWTNTTTKMISEKGEKRYFEYMGLGAKIYKLNSSQTVYGRDPGKYGNFTGVTSLSNEQLYTIVGYATAVIQDIYKGDVEGATLRESGAFKSRSTVSKIGGGILGKGDALDFKRTLFSEFLKGQENDLIEIDGVTYNANEVGNYLWGLALEYNGSFVSPNDVAEAGSFGRSDEPHEQKAITAGRAKAKEFIKSEEATDKILENRLEYRDEFKEQKDEATGN